MTIGCKKKDTVGDIPSLSIQLYQVPDSLGGSLAAYFQGGNYSSSNVQIDYTISVNSNSVNINFTGTSCAGGNCTPTSGGNTEQAVTDLKFGYLQNGSYNLNISMNGNTYSGTLSITNSVYHIDLNGGSELRFYLNHNEINRIPTNALYGYVKHYGTVPISKYFDTLSSLGVTHYTFAAGNYGNFYINSSGQMTTNLWSGDSVYILSYSGNFNLIKTVSKYCMDILRLYSSCKDGKGHNFY